MFKKLLLALVAVSSIQAAELQVRFAFIDTNGKPHEIQRCFVDPVIRNIPADKLEDALQHFVIRIVELDNGELAVRAHVKGLGGGPVTANAAYWGTKLVGWGAYGTLVFFQPHAAAEALHAYEAIEVASNAAFALGMVAPTA